MDIWRWVYDTTGQLRSEGQGALAGQIQGLANVANRGPVEQVDAVVPGLVTASRAIDRPWLEVFVRHWHLQNRLLRRRQGVAALGEAVSLYEFAHREETQDCPQSICVTQDLMICYATVDGPGYVQERLEVAEETLERIDPTWGCFECLTVEKARALLDDERPEDALEFVTAQMMLLQDAGEPPNAYLLMYEARALTRCGRPEEALERIKQSKAARGDMGGVRAQQLRMAEAEAHMAHSDVEAALEVLPDYEDVLQNLSIGTRWSQLRRQLIELGHQSDIQVAMTQAFALSTRFDASGAHRDFLRTAVDAGCLAVKSEARSMARRALERANVARSRLNRDCGAGATVAALAVRVAAMRPRAIPLPADQLAAWIKAGARLDRDGVPSLDPELPAATLDLVDVLEWCDASLEQLPNDRGLTEVAVNGLLQAGDARSARALLEAVLEHVPDDESFLAMLSSAVLEENDPEAVASMDVRLRPHHPDLAMWLMARWYGNRGQWASCLKEAEELLVSIPEGRNARRLAVRAATELQDFSTATSHADVLCELADVPPGDHWLRIEVASASQSWKSVRSASVALNLPIDSSDDPDAPVEQSWGSVAIEIPDEFTGKRNRWAATRTGPATARIIAVDPPGVHQRHGDEVAFRATPIDPPPEDADARIRTVLAFPHLATIRAGGFRSFRVEGVHPGAEAWAAFRTSLRETGRDIWVGFSRPIKSEEQPGRRRGASRKSKADDSNPDALSEPMRFFVAWLATGETSDLAEDFELLGDLTAQWEVRPAWVQLAEDAGKDADLHRSRAKELQSLTK